MERIEYRNIRDRGLWRPGPWDSEPDNIQWQDEATGLPCLIVRNRLGSWCGYVGVTEEHPAFRKEYDDEAVQNLEVHGGLTFADTCQTDDKEHGVCHIPSPGESDRVWWLGFDCLHAGNTAPGMREFPGLSEVYRDQAFVTTEVESLAKQLKEMAK